MKVVQPNELWDTLKEYASGTELDTGRVERFALHMDVDHGSAIEVIEMGGKPYSLRISKEEEREILAKFNALFGIPNSMVQTLELKCAPGEIPKIGLSMIPVHREED